MAFVLIGLYLLFPTLTNLSNLFLLLLLLSLPWFAIRYSQWRLVINDPLWWLLVAFYALILVGVLYSDAGADWVGEHLRKYARLLYAAILLLVLLGHQGLQKIALASFMWAMGLTLVSTWLNIWFLLPWSETQNLGWGFSHHVFGDYITQNVMMALFTVMLIEQGQRSETLHLRGVWWVAAVLAAISITHLSVGRTGYVVLLAALVAWVFARFRGRVLWLGIISLLVAMAVALATSATLQQRFVEAIQEAQTATENPNTSIGHRLYNYKTTWALVTESPWWGHGTGGYHTEICRHIDARFTCEQFNWHPHNQYLFLAADHGLIGVIFYSALILVLLRAGVRSSVATVKPVLFAFVAVLATNSLFNSPLWSSRESQYFAYMAALLYACAVSRPRDRLNP